MNMTKFNFLYIDVFMNLFEIKIDKRFRFHLYFLLISTKNYNFLIQTNWQDTFEETIHMSIRRLWDAFYHRQRKSMETILTGMLFYFRLTSDQHPLIQFSVSLPVLLPVLFCRIISNV